MGSLENPSGPYARPFFCDIRWSGDTRQYDRFPRVHEIIFARGQTVQGSHAAESGDSPATNPEELLAAATGACLMVTFLAVCSKAKVNVVEYRDRPEATVELEERRFRVTKIHLKPQVVLEGQVDQAMLLSAMEKAHGNCIISLSIKSEVIIEPMFKST